MAYEGENKQVDDEVPSTVHAVTNRKLTDAIFVPTVMGIAPVMFKN